MDRSIAKYNPSDAGLWRDARNTYRNLMVVEQAATGAGEGAASGLISPAKLRQATLSKHGRRNYARGKGDFAELARAGEVAMTPLPNSGTASRISARNLGVSLSSGVGGASGFALGGAPGAAIGTAVGYGAPFAAGRGVCGKTGSAVR